MVEYGMIHGIPNPRPDRPAAISCKKCKGEWFISRRVGRIREYQNTIGQQAPELDGISFWFYECLLCGHLNDAPIFYTGQDSIRKLYDNCLEAVRKHNDGLGCCKSKQ
jgi:hypothetical protein